MGHIREGLRKAIPRDAEQRLTPQEGEMRTHGFCTSNQPLPFLAPASTLLL